MGAAKMRGISVYVLPAVALIAIIFISASEQVSLGGTNLGYFDESHPVMSLPRFKRQVKTFDDEYPTASTQESEEETGFWDKVVRVALKIFNRFIEWLNSS